MRQKAKKLNQSIHQAPSLTPHYTQPPPDTGSIVSRFCWWMCFHPSLPTLQLLKRAEAQISRDQTAAALSDSLQAGWAANELTVLGQTQSRAASACERDTLWNIHIWRYDVHQTDKIANQFESRLCKVGGVSECLMPNRSQYVVYVPKWVFCWLCVVSPCCPQRFRGSRC